MKLLVFAHTPPPHHGQSYMVKLMLDGFGGDQRQRPRAARGPGVHGLECYHVNARLSRTSEDIGSFRAGKLGLLLGYCFTAIWCRYRYGVRTMYYVPCEGHRAALIRDWIVMAVCRPFFPQIILHWHAAGLGKWLERVALWHTRVLTYRLFRKAYVSVVLSELGKADAEKFWPSKLAVVHNGIPDPCPNFAQEALPRRRARLAARQKLVAGLPLTAEDRAATGSAPETVSVLFMGLCTRDKGLFDALEGVRQSNAILASQHAPVRLKLRVAGKFVTEEEQRAFDEAMQTSGADTWLEYLGFVSGEDKRKAFLESDIFCFPTFYRAESFGLVVAEAMAYGLPVVAKRWRSLPEVLPPGYVGLVAPQKPDEVAQALLAVLTAETGPALRDYFLRHFTADRFLTNLAGSIQQSGTALAKPQPQP